MPSNLSFFVFLFLSLVASANAQEGAPPAWKTPPPEELALRDNPAHPGDIAMVLDLEVFDDDVKRYETQFMRIKIFKEEGRKYANVEIPYATDMAVEEIRARTVQPDGSAIEFHGEILDQVYLKHKRANLRAKVFALPDVQPGSIIEYWYKLRWKESLPEVIMQPGAFDIRRGMTFSTAHWVLNRDLFIRRARFEIKPPRKATLVAFWAGLPEGVAPKRLQDGTMTLNVENQRGMQAEEFMPPSNLVSAQVWFYYRIGPISSVESFWSDQQRALSENIEKFIGKYKAVQREAEGLIKPGDSSEAKLRKLYARAQEVRFLTFEEEKSAKEAKREGLRENKSVEDVLKHNYAYANEINMLFAALARAARFNAQIVYLTARDSGYFDSNLLDRQQLNAAVVVVDVEGKEMFFDPATRFCPFGLLPWEESGARGVRLSGGDDRMTVNSAQLFAVTPMPPSAQAVTQRSAKLRLAKDGALDGQISVVLSGQEALQKRVRSRLGDEGGKREDMEDQVKAWLPADADLHMETTINWDAADEPLRATGTLRIAHEADVTNRRLLLPISVFNAGRPAPFHHSQRNWSIYFSYPYEVIDEIDVEIPAGYRVEALPRNRRELTPFAKFETTVEQTGGRIHFVRRFEINAVLLGRDRYEELRTFFDKVKTSDEERVVLHVTEPGANR